MKRRQMRQQQVVNDFAGAGAMFTQDPRRFRQPLQRHLPFQQRRIRCGEHHELIFQPWLGDNVCRMTWPFDKPDIHPQIGDRINHVLAIAHAQLQRQVGKISAIVGDNFRQDIVADRAAGINPDRAIVTAKQLLNLQRALQ